MRKKSSFSICLLCALLSPFSYAQSQDGVANTVQSSGSACVIAKKQGNSLAIEWTIGKTTLAEAIEYAKRKLREKGYKDVFPQANSPDPHGWLVIIQADFTLANGKKRTSYGCGFHAQSPELAEESAIIDLRSYSWSWKPELGYRVLDSIQY